MLRQFEKFLNKKFGDEAKESIQTARVLAKQQMQNRDEEIKKLQEKQRPVAFAVLRENKLLFKDGVPVEDRYFVCDTTIKQEGKKLIKCGKQHDLYDLFLYSGGFKIPSNLQTEQQILNYLFAIKHLIKFGCECGVQHKLSIRG